MVAEPTATAVTTPLFTVATESSLVLHDTVLFVALLGATVAVRVPVDPPTVRLSVVGSRVTPVTSTLLGIPPDEKEPGPCSVEPLSNVMLSVDMSVILDPLMVMVNTAASL